MGLLPSVMFWGQLTIGSTNNKIHFRETDGSTTSDRTATITSGSYYPDSVLVAESLASQIANAMTAASNYGGLYTCTVDTSDGTVTISATDGTLTGFFLMLTTAETNKLLTGGDVTATLQGFHHFGWLVDTGYPGSYALSVSSDTQICNAWHPQGPTGEYPPASLDPIDDMEVSVVETLGGRQVARNFSGLVGPHQTHYKEHLNIGFQYLTEASRLAYRTHFYLPYASGGSVFRYFSDISDLTSYEERVLREESLRRNQPIRLTGYPYFSWGLQTKLKKP